MEQQPDFFTKLKQGKIKIHLGDRSYKVPVLTLILIGATVLVLVVALLILIIGLGGEGDSQGSSDPTVPPATHAPATKEPSYTPTKAPETQQATKEPVATEPPALAYKPLEQGADDPLVAVVQQKLIDLYYMVYPDEKDGVKVTTTKFGGITVAALKAFQNRNGLTVTGKLDQVTYDKLLSSDANAYIMRKGDSLDMVKQVQKLLIEKGYLEGTADGECGDKTIEAVKKFQEAKGLTADGQAGKSTFKELMGY